MKIMENNNPQPLPDYQARYKALVKACEPIVIFTKILQDMREKEPIGDNIHQVTSSSGSATLRLSDLSAIAAAIGGE